MADCIIHIGMHKTGSTSIQASLNRFANEDFYYAQLGRPANHSLAMYSLFSESPENHHLHKANRREGAALQDYLGEMRDALEQSIAASGKRTFLISGEDISVLPQIAVEKLKTYFQARFNKVTVFGYVRPPGGFMTSAFQQRIKGGSVTTLNLYEEYRNYVSTFEKFDEIFGTDNVKLYKFDPKAFPHGCAVQDFCARLQIPLPSDRIIRLNESLSRETVALIYTYRKYGGNLGAKTLRAPQVMQLDKLFASAMANKKFRFSPNVITPVLEKNRADIEWMEKRLGQSLFEVLGEHQPDDVRNEHDLLRFDAEQLIKLRSLLPNEIASSLAAETPEEIAQIVHALRVQRIPECKAKKTGVASGAPIKHAAALNRDRLKKGVHCILHVGMHKTGTSSIQQSLNGFADKSFFYADIGPRPNHSAAIFDAFDFSLKQAATRRVRTPVTKALEALSQSIKRAGDRTYILSGEGIGLLGTDDLIQLNEYLRAHFDQITVMAAVRSPAGYMSSAFQEGLKGGGQDFLDIARQFRNYKKSFDKFDRIFGRENVQLWKFDPKNFPNGCAVRDFCNRLNLQLPFERVVRVNESLGREAMGLLYTYRKLGKDMGSMSMTGPQNHRLAESLANIGTTKFRFSPDVLRPILQKNRDDIKWMEERLEQSLHEELGEHQSGDVRDESDLLTPDQEAVEKLLAVLGDSAPAEVKGKSPEEIALLVHALRPGQVTKQARNKVIIEPKAPLLVQKVGKHADTEISTSEFIERLIQSKPELFTGIPSGPVTELVRTVFTQINDTLAATEEGVVKYGGLGHFQVRQVAKGDNGGKTFKSQIGFRHIDSASQNKREGH